MTLQVGNVLARRVELPLHLDRIVPREHQLGMQFRRRRGRLAAQRGGQEQLPRLVRGHRAQCDQERHLQSRSVLEPSAGELLQKQRRLRAAVMLLHERRRPCAAVMDL